MWVEVAEIFSEEVSVPKAYEKIRDKFIKQGMSEKQAKTHAAKIFNANRKPGTKPVTRKG